jgi:hypothetical protein
LLALRSAKPIPLESGSNFNPPPNFGGLILEILDCMDAWLDGFFIEVVKIFAFLELE